MVARQHAGDILDADQDTGSSSRGCIDFACCKKIALYCGDRYFATVGIETVTAVETHLIEILDGSHSMHRTKSVTNTNRWHATEILSVDR